MINWLKRKMMFMRSGNVKSIVNRFPHLVDGTSLNRIAGSSTAPGYEGLETDEEYRERIKKLMAQTNK